MKRFGYILIACGLGLLSYFVLTFFRSNQSIHSPIPEEQGVKVIIITPNP